MAIPPCRADRTDSGGGPFRELRELRRLVGKPNQDVGIEEDHFFMAFQCFRGTTGRSISPVILNSPARKPKRLFFRGSPGAWTSFMAERQRALKTLARICFIVPSLCL